MTSILDMCVVHQTSDNRRSLMAKIMAVFDMYMAICVRVRSRFTVPLNSGCEVSKQKQKIVFGMDRLGKIPRYLAGENQNRKKEKSNTRASENRL